MGADLLVAAYRSPTTKDGEPAKRGPELAAELKRRWDAIPVEGQGELLEILGLDATEPGEWENLSNEVCELIGDEHAEPYGRRRDVVDMCFDGKWWTLTGGPSYGDGPTEAYNAVSAIANAGITEEPV